MRTSIHYDEHGAGEPLVLLHGGFGAGESWAPILPELSAARRVITVDLPGHGRSADPGRPLRVEAFADDVAEVIESLGAGPVDVMGYSLGGMVATRIAIQHPQLTRRLVAVSVAFSRDGSHPEVLAAMDAMTPEAAAFLKQSPVYELYTRLAPRPEDFELLVARTSESLKLDYDWLDALAQLPMPVLLVYADADSVRPAHIVEAYARLGGGLRDAHWDGSLRPGNQLAILPGRTHYDIDRAPALARTVLSFLDP